MIIAIDFDGTIVKSMFPDIGDPVPQAIDVIKYLQGRGDKLILWTIRTGVYLKAFESRVVRIFSSLSGSKIVLYSLSGTIRS